VFVNDFQNYIVRILICQHGILQSYRLIFRAGLGLDEHYFHGLLIDF